MFYSDDFDNWNYSDPSASNQIFRGTLARLSQYPYGMFNSIAGCIPRGTAYTNSTKTLFTFQSFTAPIPFTYALEVAKSDNTSGNPSFSYNTITFSKTIQQTNTSTRGQYNYRTASRLGCFWDQNNPSGPRMHIVYANQDNNQGYCSIFAYVYNPEDNTFSTPTTLECNTHNLYYYNLYTNNFLNNEQIVHKINNGKVYVGYGFGFNGFSNPPAGTIKFLIYDRYNTSSGWSSFSIIVNPSQSNPRNCAFTLMNIRLAYWNDGSPVCGYIIQDQTPACNQVTPFADLHLVFNNNGAWQSSKRYAQSLWYYGGYGYSGTIDRFTGYYTPMDMYVHPLENLLHIIYVKEIQRSNPITSIADFSGRKTLRLMKVNRQGDILSDDLIFDAAVGPPAGNPIGSSYTSGIGHLKSFYKSTGPSNFTPYFYAHTYANSSPSPSYARIFKYDGNKYTQIYNIDNFGPYGDNSGNLGATTLVFT
jgi:hypothetical protein